MTRPAHPLPLHLFLAFVALVSGLVSGEGARVATDGGAPAAMAQALGTALPADESSVAAATGRPLAGVPGVEASVAWVRPLSSAPAEATPVSRFDRSRE